jgi:hypothetical protein
MAKTETTGRIKARVVSNYGRYLPGATVEVAEAEYNRLREADGGGGFRYPVLISSADQAELEAKARAREAKAQAARAEADSDRATTEGWSEYQRKAAEIVAVSRIEDQKRQHALLTGGPVLLDPEEQKRKFEENVAAGRGV